MSVQINGTNGLTFNDGSSQQTAASGFGFKNRIINGHPMIDQRNAGASVTNATTDSFPVDRMRIIGSQASKFTAQRSTTVPAGFTNSVVCTSSSAYSIGATERFLIGQWIEGYNTADLGWGTANAQSVTLSFWARSSLTGTFGIRIQNSAGDRIYIASYTISAANTWEYKSVTIAGDTTGTWLTDNSGGIGIAFSLGAGSSYLGTAGSWGSSTYFGVTGQQNLVSNNGATFYITGVQLEKGSTATSFDYRPYGTELALCQRYYEKSYQPSTKPGTNAANGYIAMFTGSNTVSGSQVYGTVFYKQQKRSSPTVTIYGYGGTSGAVSSYVGADQAASTGSADANGYESVVVFNGAGSWTTQNYWVLYHFTASAEL